jgi:hypothetical protein
MSEFQTIALSVLIFFGMIVYAGVNADNQKYKIEQIKATTELAKINGCKWREEKCT